MASYKWFLAVAVTAVLAFASVPARAQETPEARMAGQILDTLTSTMADHGWMTGTVGRPAIAASGKFDRITLPDLVFHNSAGNLLHVPPIVMNATPGAHAGEWRVTTALPPTMTLTDTNHTELARLTLSKQSFEGIYAERIRAFQTWHGQYGGVRLAMTASPGQPAFNASIATADLSAENESAPVGKARLHWRMALSGIAAAPLSPGAQSALPAHIAFDAMLADIPADRLYDAQKGQGQTLMKGMAQSGASAIIKSMTLSNNDYDLNGHANLIASATAPLGFTGSAHLSSTGLDGLVGTIGALNADPHTPLAVTSYLSNIQMALIAVNLSGQPGRDAQGRATKSFDIEMTPDGQVQLNGQSMMGVPVTATAKQR